MSYFVRVYCLESYEMDALRCTCTATPRHPVVLNEAFESIRAANDRGDEIVGVGRDDDLHWEVLDESGAVVC